MQTKAIPAVGSSDLVRPTRCQFCGESMYYVGDARHTPEVRVVVKDDMHEEMFYAHTSCWNVRMGQPNAPANRPEANHV